MNSEKATMQADVITRDCWYAGEVANQGFRLADVLNEATTDILKMYETVTGIVGCEAANVRWKEVLLRKRNILMALPKGSHEAPIRRQNNFLDKNRYGAMIVLPGHVLSGIVYLPSRGNPLMLMEEASTLSSFIAVTDVTIHNSIHGFGSSHLKVAIIQRSFIESVQLTPKQLSKQEAVAAGARK